MSSTMQPIFIVADDITGAADAANYFRTAVSQVRVSFLTETPWDYTVGDHVVQVFDTESRASTPNEATRRIQLATNELWQQFGHHCRVYKKIDSTLRGHIGLEIEQSLLGLHRTLALVAPSFPDNGRIVHDGRLLVHGQSVDQTAFAKDPHHPIQTDVIARIIQQSTSLPVLQVPLETVRSGLHAVSQFLDTVQLERGILVADAESDDDLATLASAAATLPHILPCGSAGFAKPIAQKWISNSSEINPAICHERCQRVLVAVGSANPLSHTQFAYAAKKHEMDTVDLHPHRLIESDARSNELSRVLDALSDSSTRIFGMRMGTERVAASSMQLGTPSLVEALAETSTVWIRKAWAEQSSPVGIVATGGDTALALIQALGTNVLWPEGEVAPGMPWSRVITEKGVIILVSKAGGFGVKESIHDAVSFLMKEHDNHSGR